MNQLGYFGKIPHRGDFVRFNLPRSFVTVWDDWLQQVMIRGESQHADWATRYAAAPSYRFVLSSGIAGNSPWMGLMRASQDKVGRRFPFCLAMSLDDSALPCHSVFLESRWFKAADSLLERVFSSDYEFANLQDELTALTQQAVSTPGSKVDDPVTTNDRRSSDTLTISMKSSTGLNNSDNLAPLLDTVLRQTLGVYSLWMEIDNEQTTVLNSGLPAEDAGLALFTAEWENAATALLDSALLQTARCHDDTAEDVEPVRSDTKPHHGKSVSEATTSSATDEPLDNSVESTETAAISNTDELATPVDDPVDDTSVAETPSADDWAALEQFEDSADRYTKVMVPEVERLELDEEDLLDAPWEKT